MTQDQVCEVIVGLGGKEYPDARMSGGTRCFYMKRLVGVAKCGLNDRAPSIHVITHADFEDTYNNQRFDGGVEFTVSGQAGGGRWMKALIYGVSRDEVQGLMPTIEATAAAVWSAFVASLAHEDKATASNNGD